MATTVKTFTASDLERAIRKGVQELRTAKLMPEFRNLTALRAVINPESVKSKGEQESASERMDRAVANWRNRYATYVLTGKAGDTLSDGTIFFPIPITFGGFLDLIVKLPDSLRSKEIVREYAAIIFSKLETEEKMDRAIALRFNAPSVRSLLLAGKAWRQAINAKTPDATKISKARDEFYATWTDARNEINRIGEREVTPVGEAPTTADAAVKPVSEKGNKTVASEPIIADAAVIA